MCLGLRSLARRWGKACGHILFSWRGFRSGDIAGFLARILFLWGRARRMLRCTRIFVCFGFGWLLLEICLGFARLVADFPGLDMVKGKDFCGWIERRQIDCRDCMFRLVCIFLVLAGIFVQICRLICSFLGNLLRLFDSLDIFVRLSTFLQRCFDGQWLVLVLLFFCLFGLLVLIVVFANLINFVLFCLGCFYVVNLKISIHVILVLCFLGFVFVFIVILIFMFRILSIR